MKSKKNIKSILIMAVIGIISLFFINMSLAANIAKIKVGTANLRETADENSKILEQFSMNQEVEIIEKQGNWYKVKAKGVTGYLRQDLLQITKEEPKNEENKTEENKTTEQPKTENSEVTTQENKVEGSTKKEEKKLELGKQKIAENTKLKIVPVINATDIIEVKKDEEVKATEILNDWVCVEAQNTKGWIRKEKLQSEEKPVEVTQPPVTQNTNTPNTTTPPVTTTKTLYTNSKTVNLRKQASTSSGIVASLTQNTPVEVISEANGWSKVKVSGKEGYISSALLSAQKKETSRSMETTRKETNKQQTTPKTESTTKATTTSSTPAQTTQTTKAPATSGKGSSIVAEASKYIGCKYRYGGTTPSGFDCSGFTQYVYRKFGVNLNRTAAGQYSNGVSVTKSQLQPGDLVMFGKSGISHVAIYAGGGRIVHAATSKTGVRTDSLNSGYYSKNYVGARRIL